MPDIDLGWESDFSLSATGDLLLADGSRLTQERIIRRLETGGQGLYLHPSYGAGLPERIGRVALARNIQSLCLAQVQLEATVAQIPIPTVLVGDSPTTLGAYIITINYYDNESIQQTLTFDTSAS